MTGPTGGPLQLSWCMAWGQLNWLNQASPQVAKRFFNKPTSYVVGNNPFPGPPPYWQTTVLPVFTALADYHAAGSSMSGTKYPWVCCDFENWTKTPEIEKRHIKAVLYAFIDLAHARGQKVVAAPSRDIIYAKAADEPWQWPETIDAGYLRVGIPMACRTADVFLCQAQGDQADPAAYAALVSGADDQTDPAQSMWSELTTNFATAAQMKACYDATWACGANINGFWVNIMAQSQAQIAVDFFNML